MKKGITLIELLISILFMALLGTAVLFVFTAGLRSWNSGRNYAEIIENGSLTMEKMVRDLSIATEITSAESDEVGFEADIDGNGPIDIKYDIDNNGDLIYTTGSGASKAEAVAIEDIQSFSLGYYLDLDDILYDSVKATGSEPTEADGIRIVVISLGLTEGDESMTFSGSVYTRNQGLDDE